jgi:hypothetical protein
MTRHVRPFAGHIRPNLLETAKLEFTGHVQPLAGTYLPPQLGHVQPLGYRVYKGVPYPLEP